MQSSHSFVIILLIAAVAIGVGVFLIFRFFKKPKEEDDETRTVSLTGSFNPGTKPVAPNRGGILIGNDQDPGARKDQQDSFGISNEAAIVAHE